MNSLLMLILSVVPAAPNSAAVDAAAFSQSYDLEKAGQLEDAIAVLKPVGKKSTYLLEYRLGWLNFQSKNYEASRLHYTAAMKTAPKSLEPRLGYLATSLALEKYDEAEATARAVLALDASHYTASLRLAFAMRMQGKNRPAREVLTPMLMLYPADVSLLTEQLLNSVALQQTDVAELSERIINVDPTNATAKLYATIPLPK